MPKNWSQKLPPDVYVENINGNFSSEKLIFESYFIKEPSDDVILKIITLFDLPSKSQIFINMSSIKNPTSIL